MSTLPDSDDTRDERIDRRIGQTFAFLRDVLAHPSLVEKIPSGANLRHRDVALDREHVVVRLTAFQAPTMATWAAIVTGVDGASQRATSNPNTWHMHDARGWHVHPGRGQRVVVDAEGETSEAALDALEARVRRAVEVGALPG